MKIPRQGVWGVASAGSERRFSLALPVTGAQGVSCLLMTRIRKLQLLSFVSVLAFAACLTAQTNPKMKPEETEIWTPVPAVVTPGATDAAPPSDAIVLFDGKNLDGWVNAQTGAPAEWVINDGILTVKKEKGIGNIQTKHTFKNYQLHIEWRIPENITGSGQARACRRSTCGFPSISASNSSTMLWMPSTRPVRTIMRTSRARPTTMT